MSEPRAGVVRRVEGMVMHMPSTGNLDPATPRLQVSFVCTGNRARSPLAEALFRRRISELPVEVSSWGTLDAGGDPPLAGAVAVARSMGLDIGRHRARALRPDSLCDVDLVIGFELVHLATAIERGGADHAHVFMLLEIPELLETAKPSSSLSPVDHARRTIADMHELRASSQPRYVPSLADPIGSPPHVFAEVGRVLEAVTGLLASRLFPSV